MVVLRPSLFLVVASGLALPLAVFAPKGMAPLFACVTAFAFAAHIAVRRASIPIPRRIAMAFAAFLVLTAASAAWSLTPGRSVSATLPLTGIFLSIVGLLGLVREFDAAERSRLGIALVTGMIVGMGLLLIERGFDRPILGAVTGWTGWRGDTMSFTLKPVATVAALLVWPFALVLARRFPRMSVPAAAGVIAGIAFIGSDAAVFGLACGVGIFLFARWRPRLAGPFLGANLAILILTAPWIPSLFPDPRVSMTGIEYLPNSGVHRIVIWQTTAGHIFERPWLGYGFDTSRKFYPQSTTMDVKFAKPTIGQSEGFTAEPIPLHPHNMILQIWLELGFVGALVALATILAILFGLARAQLADIERAVGYGYFVTTLAIAAVAYGAWQAWWLSTIGLSAVLLVGTFSSSSKRAPSHSITPI